MLVDQITNTLRHMAARGMFRNEHVMHWANAWVAGEGRTDIDGARAALHHAQNNGEAYCVRDAILAVIYHAECVALIQRAAAELK